MCFTVFLYAPDTAYEMQGGIFSSADKITGLNFTSGDDGIFYSKDGNFLNHKELVNHRRRTQDRNCGFSLGILQDKIDIAPPHLSTEVPVVLSCVNNICLSSCYNFIFRLSPF